MSTRTKPSRSSRGRTRFGIRYFDDRVLFTIVLDVLDGQIQTIRSVNNPDKLGHVGPVADLRATMTELSQARRPS